jgi:hypothetical protein
MVSALPSTVDEKPHCGLRQSWSSDTYFTASSIRHFSRHFPRFRLVVRPGSRLGESRATGYRTLGSQKVIEPTSWPRRCAEMPCLAYIEALLASDPALFMPTQVTPGAGRSATGFRRTSAAIPRPRHLECDLAAVAHDLRADLDQLLAHGGQRPASAALRITRVRMKLPRWEART